MSTQSPQRPLGSPDQPEDAGGQKGSGGFLRTFLTVQGVFLLFLLIASINEVPSVYTPVSAVSSATQMALVGTLWALTDVSALAVHALHVHRTRR
jgi:hypothetical protein